MRVETPQENTEKHVDTYRTSREDTRKHVDTRRVEIKHKVMGRGKMVWGDVDMVNEFRRNEEVGDTGVQQDMDNVGCGTFWGTNLGWHIHRAPLEIVE